MLSNQLQNHVIGILGQEISWNCVYIVLSGSTYFLSEIIFLSLWFYSFLSFVKYEEMNTVLYPLVIEIDLIIYLKILSNIVLFGPWISLFVSSLLIVVFLPNQPPNLLSIGLAIELFLESHACMHFDKFCCNPNIIIMFIRHGIFYNDAI